MIGGNDIIFPVAGDSAALEACALILARQWPDVRFEDAITGIKYQRLSVIPLGRVRELLIYRDAAAEAAWDAESPNCAENSMLSLIVRPEDITIVVDNPGTEEMKSVLASIRDLLRTGFDSLFTYVGTAV
jgi:hypothetical protein